MEGVQGGGPVPVCKKLIARRLLIEYAYYKSVGHSGEFFDYWGLEGCLCRQGESGDMHLEF